MVPTVPSTVVNSDTDFDTQLNRIDGKKITAIMFVYGTGPDIEKVKFVCEHRADEDADVAWCPDTTKLSQTQQQKFLLNGHVAVAVGKKRAIAASLTLEEGQSSFSVSEAFTDAQLESIGS